ncbi:MAG: nucleotidyltransferase domain-containing protein [Chloroflexota bacterium]
MTESDVIAVLDVLDGAGVDVWIDGGWGVDALLGRTTRQHADLDLALDRRSLAVAVPALAHLGFQPDRSALPGPPARVVLVDPGGRRLDLHPLVFDADGNGWQQLSTTGRAWGLYPARDLTANGTIGGRPVRCISAALQVRFRLGYEWTANDVHDLRVLAIAFGVASLPPGLRGEGE